MFLGMQGLAPEVCSEYVRVGSEGEQFEDSFYYQQSSSSHGIGYRATARALGTLCPVSGTNH